MSSDLSRREVLKLISLLPILGGMPPSYFAEPESPQKKGNAPNVLIILFDTLSAKNVSLYGYPRKTMPRLERIAERATVYHNHHSAGMFTTPGTASLLTGTYPWTHRAFQFADYVTKPYDTNNIFGQFENQGYFRSAYTHNPLADTLLRQFDGKLTQHTPRTDLFLRKDFWVSRLLGRDNDMAEISRRMLLQRMDGYSSSLFISNIYQPVANSYIEKVKDRYKELYPRGLTNIDEINFFLLEEAIDWIQIQINEMPQPFLAYFHLMPPHGPYRTRVDFVDIFRDLWLPSRKPEHVLARGNSWKELLDQRRLYDEFIPLVDAEFERLFRFLEESGTLDNTWVILTSDHGEMFERGILGHSWITLHQPVLQVPLLIFEPGQKERRDIFNVTNSVDLLPTLLHITGQEIPAWCEGTILPPFDEGDQNEQRSTFGFDAKRNLGNGPVTIGTGAIYKEQYKLMHYFGYEGHEPFSELFNLEDDPEELNDLAGEQPMVAKNLLDELLQRINEADEPYRR